MDLQNNEVCTNDYFHCADLFFIYMNGMYLSRRNDWELSHMDCLLEIFIVAGNTNIDCTDIYSQPDVAAVVFAAFLFLLLFFVISPFFSSSALVFI